MSAFAHGLRPDAHILPVAITLAFAGDLCAQTTEVTAPRGPAVAAPAGAGSPSEGAPRTEVHTSEPTEVHEAEAGDGSPGAVEGDVRWTDAHADRVVLLPTAETHPEGTVYLSDYEIVIPQIGYAISDRTQITLTSTPPLGEDLAFLSDLTLKTVLVREGYVRVAATGSVTGLFGLEDESLMLGRVGAIVQGCFDPACRSSLNLGSTLLLAGPASMSASGAGLVWRATTALSLLVEAHTLLPLGREAGAFNGIGLASGLRLGWTRFAIDLAVEALPEAEVDGDAAPPILPFLALTYRFLPDPPPGVIP